MGRQFAAAASYPRICWSRTRMMRELIRTNDVVVIDLARTVLEEAGLMVMVADASMSAIEGSIGMFPRRLLVVESEMEEARALMQEAGLSSWLIKT